MCDPWRATLHKKNIVFYACHSCFCLTCHSQKFRPTEKTKTVQSIPLFYLDSSDVNILLYLCLPFFSITFSELFESKVQIYVPLPLIFFLKVFVFLVFCNLKFLSLCVVSLCWHFDEYYQVFFFVFFFW